MEPEGQSIHYEESGGCSPTARYPNRGRISFADPSFSQETGSFMVRA
ncbi:MAG: hypothetical protein IPL58_10095 [Betaproteobacteria bacterium]|uniref:Uncharacterized protein n=1 Tax=Candidatus Proximibacter danicus TaxID=2954365 RepID=A0A9D7K268_9PROT|nr:hypothetical protein [Candidatus Proximibacter danicus]